MGAFGSGKLSFSRHLISDVPRLPLQSLPSFGKSVDLRWGNPAGALFARVTRTAAGLELIETSGSSVHVDLRSWPMPRGRGGLHGVRLRMICPRCGSSRDVLHWRGEWGCRGKDCLDLDFASRHQQRYCPAIRRRAKLLRKLARCAPRGLQARLLRAQIAREEAAMLANLKRANRNLTKRVKRHGRQRRIDLSE